MSDRGHVNPSKAENRYRRAMRDATETMFGGGMTYGQASGAPDFLNQAAWCRHFPSGNGAKCAALVKRATKAGAFPG